MSDLIRLSAAELGERLAAGDVSSVEATPRPPRPHRRRRRRRARVPPRRRASAHSRPPPSVDRRRAAGEPLGPLAGVPIAIKDVLVTEGMPSTAGSRILEGWIPPYDATPVRQVREAGMVPLGKTNMDEFAMGSSTEHSAYGPTHNPWDLERIPGGSGGGSAASVAAFEAPLALGSDTGGSIRQPAHVTGTVGVKPTYGAVSRYGSIALASSLDQIGPVTPHGARRGPAARRHRRARPARLDVDPRGLAVDGRARVRRADVSGLRIGVVKELDSDGFQAGVRQRFHEALDLLEQQGAEIVEVSAPHFEYSIAAYYLILPAEASSQPGEVRLGALRPAGRRPTAAARSSRSWRPRARPASAPR